MKYELLQFTMDLYEAMQGEYMPCPFCSSRIGGDDENHDEYCHLPKMIADIKAEMAAKAMAG